MNSSALARLFTETCFVSDEGNATQCIEWPVHVMLKDLTSMEGRSQNGLTGSLVGALDHGWHNVVLEDGAIGRYRPQNFVQCDEWDECLCGQLEATGSEFGVQTADAQMPEPAKLQLHYSATIDGEDYDLITTYQMEERGDHMLAEKIQMEATVRFDDGTIDEDDQRVPRMVTDEALCRAQTGALCQALSIAIKNKDAKLCFCLGLAAFKDLLDGSEAKWRLLDLLVAIESKTHSPDEPSVASSTLKVHCGEAMEQCEQVQNHHFSHAPDVNLRVTPLPPPPPNARRCSNPVRDPEVWCSGSALLRCRSRRIERNFPQLGPFQPRGSVECIWSCAETQWRIRQGAPCIQRGNCCEKRCNHQC
jgi:hypothetical protein